MANLLTRDERFQNFQSLIADLKNDGAIPAQILTRLYNGFTSEFTKAEAEIKRLHDANRILTDEMHTSEQQLSNVPPQLTRPAPSTLCELALKQAVFLKQ